MVDTSSIIGWGFLAIFRHGEANLFFHSIIDKWPLNEVKKPKLLPSFAADDIVDGGKRGAVVKAWLKTASLNTRCRAVRAPVSSIRWSLFLCHCPSLSFDTLKECRAWPFLLQLRVQQFSVHFPILLLPFLAFSTSPKFLPRLSPEYPGGGPRLSDNPDLCCE